ncbi:MAG TPA: L-glyceraldehyde 3-phosphate reductase, partial [Ruminococcus sp.]|nr:L-glyceraldehyde 3-phosphate reductase [Ruminococcus sp.]
RDGRVTSVLIGASSPEQIKENIQAVYKTSFTPDEIEEIEKILG